MAAYVDGDARIEDSLFPSASPAAAIPAEDRQQLLVLSLDFANLKLPEGGDEHSLLDLCDAFFDDQLCRDLYRYRLFLQPIGDELPEVTSARELMVSHRTTS